LIKEIKDLPIVNHQNIDISSHSNLIKNLLSQFLRNLKILIFNFNIILLV